jgi:uncharacterized membrane protein YjgN (DUF898 family)
MTALVVSPPPAESVSPPTAWAAFTGSSAAFRELMTRGALLQVVTLGIYRFWLTTDARRFLWANTEVDGDSLEYTGTAVELLIGFLIAIALLVPIYVLFFIGSLEYGLVSEFSSAFAAVGLAGFGQYAYYRARRYRLTRTVFRGVRFHQAGSAWAYALRSILWSIAVLATLGLAYPWAQASLERYKLSQTFYGDLQGQFTASGTSLFVRGIALWLILIVSLAAAIAIVATAVDWAALGRAVRAGGHDPRIPHFIGLVTAVTIAFVLMAFAVYAALQAIVLRWWLSGLRFGEVAISTKLRLRQVFGAYLRLVLWAGLLVLAITTAVGLAVIAVPPAVKSGGTVVGLLTALAYLVAAIGTWIIYQVVVKLGIWRAAVDSVEISGFDAVARVRADDTRPSSAVGEGLADALGAGGI